MMLQQTVSLNKPLTIDWTVAHIFCIHDYFKVQS